MIKWFNNWIDKIITLVDNNVSAWIAGFKVYFFLNISKVKGLYMK